MEDIENAVRNRLIEHNLGILDYESPAYARVLDKIKNRFLKGLIDLGISIALYPERDPAFTGFISGFVMSDKKIWSELEKEMGRGFSDMGESLTKSFSPESLNAEFRKSHTASGREENRNLFSKILASDTNNGSKQAVERLMAKTEKGYVMQDLLVKKLVSQAGVYGLDYVLREENIQKTEKEALPTIEDYMADYTDKLIEDTMESVKAFTDVSLNAENKAQSDKETLLVYQNLGTLLEYASSPFFRSHPLYPALLRLCSSIS